MLEVHDDITAAHAVRVVRVNGKKRVKVSEIFAEYVFDAIAVATLAVCFFL